MVLEACVLCIDNSDFMRNGDFAPSRMEAQTDSEKTFGTLAEKSSMLRALSCGYCFASLPGPDARRASSFTEGGCR